MLVYGLLGLSQTIIAFFFSLVVVLGGLKAAINFHNQAFKKVLFSPVSFFDTTPLGRIINRFSKDQDSIDNSISDSLRMFVFTFSGCVGTLILICVVS